MFWKALLQACVAMKIFAESSSSNIQELSIKPTSLSHP
jgi:hypothetical protein